MFDMLQAKNIMGLREKKIEGSPVNYVQNLVYCLIFLIYTYIRIICFFFFNFLYINNLLILRFYLHCSLISREEFASIIVKYASRLQIFIFT